MNTKQKATNKEPQELVQNLLRGEIDGRTRQAQQFLATRDAVREVGAGEMSRVLLQDQLCAWSIAQRLVLSEIAQAKTLFADGELSPLFGQLQTIESSILRISKALQQEPAKATRNTKASKADDAPIDVSILFDDEVQP